jgi:hypothetical protein
MAHIFNINLMYMSNINYCNIGSYYHNLTLVFFMSFCELDPTKLAYIFKGRYLMSMEFKSTKLEIFNGVKN